MPENTVPAQPFIIASTEGWYLLIKVLPGAKQNALCGCEGERLKIRLTAPAVDNKANEALLGFMAKTLDIGREGLLLVAGAKSRKKKLFLSAGQKPDWSGISAWSAAKM
ncbi:MAG: DUF167 domain-containing protein [Desulfovibrionaceae bacterium]|nr:DUF167 domain-containing protein [Desulfovibrionaceae bacterium]